MAEGQMGQLLGILGAALGFVVIFGAVAFFQNRKLSGQESGRAEVAASHGWQLTENDDSGPIWVMSGSHQGVAVEVRAIRPRYEGIPMGGFDQRHRTELVGKVSGGPWVVVPAVDGAPADATVQTALMALVGAKGAAAVKSGERVSLGSDFDAKYSLFAVDADAARASLPDAARSALLAHSGADPAVLLSGGELVVRVGEDLQKPAAIEAFLATALPVLEGAR